MKAKFIGIGAAGGKAIITGVERGVMSENEVMIINSTLRDVPESYRHLATQLSGGNGCGKERGLSKALCLNSIKDETLAKLDSFADPDDKLIVIVSSTAGGTGSGSAPIIAQYFKNAIGKKVQCFAFTGFEEDGRELQNTIEYFQEMEEDITVQAISNKKFLEEAGNRSKAEKMANDEFVDRVEILLGHGLIDSEQNIDETDLFKVATTEGYMTILSASLDRLKNVEQYNKAITAMLDEEKALEISEKGMKRLAVFFNVPEKMYDFLDEDHTLIKERLGIPYESFTHKQYNPELATQVSLIASGMKMPIEEVREIYNKYKEESEKVNKTKDEFFDLMFKGNKEDKMFDSAITNSTPLQSKADFLSKHFEKPRRKEIEETINEEPIAKF